MDGLSPHCQYLWTSQIHISDKYVWTLLVLDTSCCKLDVKAVINCIHQLSENKGRCHLRFSGIRPLRGYPPPPLNGKSV